MKLAGVQVQLRGRAVLQNTLLVIFVKLAFLGSCPVKSLPVVSSKWMGGEAFTVYEVGHSEI